MWEEFGAAQTLRFRGPIFRLRLTVTFTRNHFDLFQISVMLFVRLFWLFVGQVVATKIAGNTASKN
jgi:hypothetical protein